MNRIMIGIILFGNLLLTACEQEKDITQLESSDKPPLQALLDYDKRIEDTFNEAPQKFQEKVVAPDISSIPFRVEEVSMEYFANEYDFASVRITYWGEDKSLNIIIFKFDENEKETLNDEHPVQLSDGVEGYYEEEYFNVDLDWYDPNGEKNLFYRVVLTTFEEDSYTRTENKVFGIEDAVNIANSILDNTKF